MDEQYATLTDERAEWFSIWTVQMGRLLGLAMAGTRQREDIEGKLADETLAASERLEWSVALAKLDQSQELLDATFAIGIDGMQKAWANIRADG